MGNNQGKDQVCRAGSMNVKADGKNIQLLGDAMSNNGSNPDNSAQFQAMCRVRKHRRHSKRQLVRQMLRNFVMLPAKP